MAERPGDEEKWVEKESNEKTKKKEKSCCEGENIETSTSAKVRGIENKTKKKGSNRRGQSQKPEGKEGARGGEKVRERKSEREKE